MHNVLLTGGAGYLGCVLTPKLLAAGHRVTVFDSMLFGRDGLASVSDHPALRIVAEDLRDSDALAAAVEGHDAVIHLAAISNDPSSELDPALTEQVNLVAVWRLIDLAHGAGVRRFLYASSASVYGIKDVADVTEDLPLDPITTYARCKALGEDALLEKCSADFVGVMVRAATVCGWSPRLRLDLTINILTTHALKAGRIRVFGGTQLRPNVHIEDLTDAYVMLLDAPAEAVNGQAFNICRSNASVMELAQMIREQVNPELPVLVEPTDDLRSYHLSGEKIAAALDYRPSRPLAQAVDDLCTAFADGRVPDHEDIRYRNVAWMQAHPERWRDAT